MTEVASVVVRLVVVIVDGEAGVEDGKGDDEDDPGHPEVAGHVDRPASRMDGRMQGQQAHKNIYKHINKNV